MKRVVIPNYHIEIELKENTIHTLVIENPIVYRVFVQSFFCDNDFIIFSDRDKIYDLQKSAEFISNIFDIDCNSRKILTAIYNQLADFIKEIGYESYSNLNASVIDIIDRAIDDSNYPLSYEPNLDIVGMLKLLNVRLSIDSSNQLSYLFYYLKLRKRLYSIDLFVIANLKAYFTETELNLFIRDALYEKINLIILENIETPIYLDHEQKLILDKDLCIIKI